MNMLDVYLLGVIIESCNCKADGFQGHATLLYLLMRNTKRVCWGSSTAAVASPSARNGNLMQLIR